MSVSLIGQGMHLLFLIPLILCLLWAVFLNLNGYSVKQGAKGFYYIIAGTLISAGILALLLFITR